MIQQLGFKEGQVFFKCPKCCSIKPERAHHCSVCQRCIRKMDHHCPWVNNCVGENNQKYFVLFTVRPIYYIMFYSFILLNSNLWFLVIHCINIDTCNVLNGQSICPMYKAWMETMLIIFTTGHCNFITFSNIRSFVVCRIHNDYAGYAIECHLEWWNGMLCLLIKHFGVLLKSFVLV